MNQFNALFDRWKTLTLELAAVAHDEARDPEKANKFLLTCNDAGAKLSRHMKEPQP